MSVNLSFIGGAGWQFLDNNAKPLSGGKVYTYSAGTTTPLATYTSRSGLIANTNPIILDAAGRTPEQIWSTEGLIYKYVVTTSTDVLIRTWDNIGGSVVPSDLAVSLADTTDNAKGDALIGFRQSNSLGFVTGAVARTVNQKLQEITSVLDFNVVGDGVTDDYAALQQAIDATPTGTTLHFDGRSYYISRVLDVTKTINIDFANSTLILGPNNAPFNRHLNINSLTAADVTFTQTVLLGDSVLSVSGTGIAEGDYILVRLGVDPYDPNEPNWARVCRVTASTGSTVTIDHRVPYNINGTSHKINRITSLVAGCSFKNLVMTYSSGVPDTHIYPSRCFNVIFENIRADKVRIMFNPFYCHNMVFRNIQCTTFQAGFPSHGRVFTAWQIENVLIENVDSTSPDASGGFFFESWCRQVLVRNATVSTKTLSSGGNFSQITGGSYDIQFENITADILNGEIFTSGAAPGDYTARNVRMLSFPNQININRVTSFTDVANNVVIREGANNIATERLQVAMQPSWNNRPFTLVRGYAKQIWLYVEDKTHITSFFVLGLGGQGYSSLGYLVNTQWSSIPDVGFYGAGYPFNNAANIDKRIILSTAATMVAGTLLTVVVQYWPIASTNEYVFPPKIDV